MRAGWVRRTADNPSTRAAGRPRKAPQAGWNDLVPLEIGVKKDLRVGRSAKFTVTFDVDYPERAERNTLPTFGSASVVYDFSTGRVTNIDCEDGPTFWNATPAEYQPNTDHKALSAHGLKGHPVVWGFDGFDEATDSILAALVGEILGTRRTRHLAVASRRGPPIRGFVVEYEEGHPGEWGFDKLGERIVEAMNAAARNMPEAGREYLRPRRSTPHRGREAAASHADEPTEDRGPATRRTTGEMAEQETKQGRDRPPTKFGSLVGERYIVRSFGPYEFVAEVELTNIAYNKGWLHVWGAICESSASDSSLVTGFGKQRATVWLAPHSASDLQEDAGARAVVAVVPVGGGAYQGYGGRRRGGVAVAAPREHGDGRDAEGAAEHDASVRRRALGSARDAHRRSPRARGHAPPSPLRTAGSVLRDRRGGPSVVLLPGAEVPEGAAVGDAIPLFVYLDSEDRPIATTRTPRITLGEVAFLRVTDVTRFGAFVDWGLAKDLLVPFAEQTRDVRVGDRHPVGLYIDDTRRLAGTMRVAEMLREGGDFAPDEWVDGESWRLEPEIGTFVIVERRFVGMIPADEPHRLARGDAARFRVSHVHRDGKIELSLRGHAHEEREADTAGVVAYLSRKDAAPIGDRSSPEVIRAAVGLSKKAFKRAAGALLKSGEARIDAEGFSCSEGEVSTFPRRHTRGREGRSPG